MEAQINLNFCNKRFFGSPIFKTTSFSTFIVGFLSQIVGFLVGFVVKVWSRISGENNNHCSNFL